MLTCLLESIADDDDVTPTPTGRLRSVGPPVAKEANPRPAHTTALRALELRAILRWGDLAGCVPLLSAHLSFGSTGGFKVPETLEACGTPLRSVKGIFFKFVWVYVEISQGLFKLVLVALLGALGQPSSLRELPIEHLFWESVIGHSVYVSRPPQLGSCEDSFYGFQFSSAQHFSMGDSIPPCNTEYLLHASHMKTLQKS